MMSDLEKSIRQYGTEIFLLALEKQKRRIDPVSKLLEWTMRDESLKVPLFHLTDVLPNLESSLSVVQHLQGYLKNSDLPEGLRAFLSAGAIVPPVTAFLARKSVKQIAHRFIAAKDEKQAAKKFHKLFREGIAFSADLLGESVVSESEALVYQERYLRLIQILSLEAEQWETTPDTGRDFLGTTPHVNVSVKISAFYSQIYPTDPETALHHLAERLRPVLRSAKLHNVFINFDMESYALKEITLTLFKSLLEEQEFRDYPHFGIALQAYLRDSKTDLLALIEWAKKRGTPIAIRLVKGAYWDYETVIARQREWPSPVFAKKAETDANYETLSQIMLANSQWIRSAFATHNVRSMAACIAQAEEAGLSLDAYEFQMLYGMGEPLKEALVELGYRVRCYCPVGEILPGMSYLVRRLLENTSNEGFLRRAFSEKTSPEKLLANPETDISDAVPEITGRFHNTPPIDFTIESNRHEMTAALKTVSQQFGKHYPVIVSGREINTEEKLVSTNPAHPSEVIGSVGKARVAEAEMALKGARAGFDEWKLVPVEERAQTIEHVAELLEARRFEFAALEVFEVGKNWQESDADVTEAIDFCRFYAREIRRINERSMQVPGEANLYHYFPRGVAVVIAPWNFPLAILCGMTVAALVTGNAVVLKPSSQSAVIAAHFVNLLLEAGVPGNCIHFLPGSGGEIGDYLVAHHEVDLICFTGSREVGTRIYENAAVVREGQRHLKKVICEMGGKNAMIVDDDADLDEAIPAILASAFGYQGQKCSALSRLIVLEKIHDRLVRRLLEACKSLIMGDAANPGALIGPVIDSSARERILKIIAIGKSEAQLLYQSKTPEGEGYYVPLTIFDDVPEHAQIAQEEIFGPVLSILVVPSIERAIDVANNTRYALTGGLYSRNPMHIEKVKRELEVGNLYINRAITGAIVGRQPFGGFRMSGGGTQAGGEDYLQNFMFPRTITENLIRHGFAPSEER